MNRAEYEARALEFRALLIAEGMKPPGEQNWPEFSDWLSVEGTSTCTTPTCPVFGQPFPVVLHENADGVYRGQCGRCQNSITPVPTFEGE